MFVTLALVYVFVAAMRRASAGLRAEGGGTTTTRRATSCASRSGRSRASWWPRWWPSCRRSSRSLTGPMIYGSVRPNFWRKRSMVFLVTFIVDSVVNDLCLMAVAFV